MRPRLFTAEDAPRSISRSSTRNSFNEAAAIHRGRRTPDKRLQALRLTKQPREVLK